MLGPQHHTCVNQEVSGACASWKAMESHGLGWTTSPAFSKLMPPLTGRKLSRVEDSGLFQDTSDQGTKEWCGPRVGVIEDAGKFMQGMAVPR